MESAVLPHALILIIIRSLFVIFLLCSLFLCLSTCILVKLADRLLQPADRPVNDFVGDVHGDVRHREPEGLAALSLLPQENWR